MFFVFLLALAGGLFGIMTFIHFFVDWIFQSHAEAMVKHNNPKIRAKHCAIYTLGFVPLLMFFMWAGALTSTQLLASVLILFISHFIEDTYLPVFYWAKYIRRPPEMAPPADPKVGFGLFVQTAIGKILMITIDQIIHLAFLFPIVWMVMGHLAQGMFP